MKEHKERIESLTSMAVTVYEEDMANLILDLDTTITQQADRIKELEEALRNISGRGGYMPTTDYRQEVKIMQRIAQAILKKE